MINVYKTILTCVTASVVAITWLQVAVAATPSSGMLTPDSGSITYTAGPFLVANPTPVLLVDNGPECNGEVQPCDSFALTVALPDNFIETNPDALIKATLSWNDTASGASDYDFYIFNGAVVNTNGSQAAQAQGASSGNPEVAALQAFNGARTFTIKVVPFTPTAETVEVKIELAAGADSGASGGGSNPAAAVFGQAHPTAPELPRYQNFFAPEGSRARGSSGEANIGFNPITQNIMLMNNAPVFRLTPPELRTPVLPEAGPALWTNVSPLVASITTLDPILVTDPDTGRTFISNQTSGANLLFAFTDDDGASWIQASASPPPGGVDHQTIGVGPYPPLLAGINPVYPNAVYYCTQALFPDFCQRSDDGGLSFGPGVAINTGLGGCGGLHGHVKVSPTTGTVVVPDASCGARQGISLSKNAGVTWSESVIEDSGPGVGNDPSVAYATDGTAYFCYTTPGGAWVAVSHDDGNSWGPSVNISSQVGVKNAVFPQAVAGDPDRAACGFIGTDVPGSFQGLEFPGKWYLFIAHTYDGGNSWTTVNATPNDPVQGKGGICTGGTTCGSNRNLLDFNEVTMDDVGRVLFAYDDGCVSDTCLQSGGDLNDFVGHWRVARQFGGKTLLASFDPVEPAPPKAPYLASAVQNGDQVALSWNRPDDSGSEISSYRIFRDGVEIGQQLGTKTSFVDTTTASAPAYKIRAQNSIGLGPFSNVVSTSAGGGGSTSGLPVACELPGALVSEDAAGDQTTLLPGHDALKVFVAEPFFADDIDRFVLSMEVDELGLQPFPPNTSYEVHFKLPGDLPPVEERVVSFDSTTGEFTFGHTELDPVTGVNSRFDDGPADQGSALDIDNNQIVWVVRKDRLATLASATALQAVSAQVWQSGVAVLLRVDDSPAAGYTVIGNAACAPSPGDLNTPPLAVLSADPTSGTAPLTVTFDAGASFDRDDGDTITEYRFDFGDASPPVTQMEPMVVHTYMRAGDFRATLTVTDANATMSENAAFVGITAQDGNGGGQEQVDVTDRIRLRADNTSFTNGVVRYDLRLENSSNTAIDTPLRSEIVQMSSQSGTVTAANADNGEPGVGAFWRYDDKAGADNQLTAGEISEFRNLAFDDPNGESFSVTYRVFSGAEPTTANSDDGAAAAATLIEVTVNPLLNQISVEVLNRTQLGVW